MSKNSHAKHEHHKKASNDSFETPHEDYKAGVFGDVIIGLLIFGLGLIFVLPFYFVLKGSAQVFVMVIFVLIIIVFALFMWHKKIRK